MARGSQDLVDCARLAEESATLERAYALQDLPRLQDLLAARHGTLNATFAFAKTPTGGAGATVTIESAASLVCQRCLQGFVLPVAASSELEFTMQGRTGQHGSGREAYELHEGLVSLRGLAEEEFLLALPLAPACSTPESCGRAPARRSEPLRPFGVLQDLLKKTDRT